MDRLAVYLEDGRERSALLLVPTLSQASHVKRLLLSRYGDLGGFFDESVVTFTSLAEKILPARPIGELLSGLRLDLFLRRILMESGAAPFRRLVRYPGFRRSALAFLKELKQNGLPGEDVLERLDAMAASGPAAVGDRLRGFRDIFAAYEAAREAEGLIDHEDYLREARDVLVAGLASGREGGTHGLDVELFAVDGFQNFTTLERDLLLRVGDRAGETLVTLPWDSRLDAERGRHFQVAAETHDFLLSRGFTRQPLFRNQRGENHRALSVDLAHLERQLFAPEPEVVAAEGTIRGIEAADPTDEADRVARTVLRLVRGDFGKAYRYQDVVVVVREAGGREERFRAAFRRHDIPLRIYGSVPLAGHAFVRAALDLTALAGGRLESETVLSLLRADPVTGIDRTALDRLEADLIESGPPDTPDGWIERAAAHSESAAELLADLAGFDAAARTGERWAEALLALVARYLTPLAERDVSDVDRVRRDAQAVTAFRTALAESARALPETVSFEEFVRLLREVLRTAVATSRDRRLAVVNLIGAREARQWEAPVVIVAGLTEGEFPRAPREDLFVPDAERRRANEERRLALRERALDRHEERYLFYVAMTRARERLFLIWPATDGSGRESLRSLYLDDVFRLFTHAEDLISRRKLSDALPLPRETVGREDLRIRALLDLATTGTATEAEGAALHDRFLADGDPAYARAVRRAAAFFRPREARLEDLTGLPPRRRHSASALEDFAQCPFRHFAGRTLRLERPRAAGELDALLLGDIAHEVLARLFEPARDGGPMPDPDSVDARVAETFAARAPFAVEGLVTGRVRAEMIRSLRALVVREARRLAGGPWRPAFLEASFGRGDHELTVPGEGGEPVRLIGRVDRIDTDGDLDKHGDDGDGDDGDGVGGIIIDYKYSRKGFAADRRRAAEEGAHLQLPIYLLALRDAFGLEPRGAWLYPVRDPETSGYSILGGPSADRPVPLDDDGLSDLLERTTAFIADYDRRIREGEIEIRPKDTKLCSWCDFADLCRFEAWMATGADE